MNGFVNILKPPGMTSHDVVGWMRRKTGIKKIGHTGTLDPDVAGVLVLAIGQATRLSEYVLIFPKSYRCEILLGIKTDTEDLSGNIIMQKKVKNECIKDYKNILNSFIGEIEQIPPMMSAVHHKGKRLYELARQGIVVERKSRKANIYKLEVVEEFFDNEQYRILFDVDCSKGTYIRTLCKDFGDVLGCGATMCYLIRTAYGPFKINNAWTLEEIEDNISKNNNSEYLLSMGIALPNMIKLIVKENAKSLVLNGCKTKLNHYIYNDSTIEENSEVVIYSIDNKLLGIGRLRIESNNGRYIKLSKVFNI